MKKSYLVLFFATLLLLSFVSAQGEDEQTVRDAKIDLRLAELDLSATEAIAYIEELGGDTTTLSDIWAEFDGTETDQVRPIVTDFREEARIQIEANDGSITDLRERIDSAIANDEAISDLRAALHDASRPFVERRLNNHITHLQRALERIESAYGDEQPEQLTRMSAIITELELLVEEIAATDSIEQQRELGAQAKELIQEFRGLAREVVGDRDSPRPRRHGQLVRMENTLAKMDRLIQHVEGEGEDVAALVELYDQAKDEFESLSAALVEQDRESSRASITAFKDIVQEFNQLAREFRTDQDRFVDAVAVADRQLDTEVDL